MPNGPKVDAGDTAGAAQSYDRATLRRQEGFRLAADYVAQAFGCVPAVSKVVLFGSVAMPLGREVPRRRPPRGTTAPAFQECKDVDLAVWLSDLTQLGALQRARSDALKRLLAEHSVGVAHHEVDVFLMEPGTDRLLEWLCYFTTCPKQGKAECLTPGCGAVPLLRRDERFVLDPAAFRSEGVQVLFERRAGTGECHLEGGQE